MKPWMFGKSAKTILELFGERIRKSRKLRMITAERLAADSGIARSTLALIEKGAPGVSMGSYIGVLISLGFERRLLEFIIEDPLHPALKKYRVQRYNDQ